NDLINKNDHLLCFAVRVTQPAGFIPPANPWFDSNQFGVGQLNIANPTQLCVPSLKDEVPPPPPTTATTVVGQPTTTTTPCDPASGNPNCQPVQPPVLNKSFNATSISPGGTPVPLVFTVNNPNSSTTLTGINFNDNLPPGLVVATPNGLAGGCP